jgi:ribosomal protein L11 methyltransferase
VVENLEDGDGGSITKSSETKAGENDTLPLSGLCIAEFRILAANSPYVDDKDQHHPIRLLVGRNGWGTGIHPTTRLCLEWLSKTLKGGEVLLDYGCGSGILSIAAIHTGASRAIGVDVEAEALVTAERNVELNFGSTDKFQALHVRQILPNDLGRPHGVDLCVANILVGQLVRPSMVSAIVTNVAPGGLLCLSGIRPQEVESLKTAYNAYIQEWVEDDYAELSATETEASVDSYGFDVGTWSRLVGRLNDRGNIDVEAMSELAVS